MIPRVSAALAQFIAPIATSEKHNSGAKPGFERFVIPSKKREREESPSERRPPDPDPGGGKPLRAQIIPFPSKEGGLANGLAASSAPIPAGITQALLQLVNMLHEQRATLLRWIGTGVYQSASRQQKRNGRIRKGTIVDHQAD